MQFLCLSEQLTCAVDRSVANFKPSTTLDLVRGESDCNGVPRRQPRVGSVRRAKHEVPVGGIDVANLDVISTAPTRHVQVHVFEIKADVLRGHTRQAEQRWSCRRVNVSSLQLSPDERPLSSEGKGKFCRRARILVRPAKKNDRKITKQ